MAGRYTPPKLMWAGRFNFSAALELTNTEARMMGLTQNPNPLLSQQIPALLDRIETKIEELWNARMEIMRQVTSQEMAQLMINGRQLQRNLGDREHLTCCMRTRT